MFKPIVVYNYIMHKYERKLLGFEKPIFPGLEEPRLRKIGSQLATIQTNSGCGGRICRMCGFSSSPHVISADEEQIVALHKIKSTYMDRNDNSSTHLRHDFDGEALQYKGKYWNYANVVKDAVQRGIVVGIYTHGWFAEDPIPNLAIEEIAKFYSDFQQNIILNFSIDTFGFFDIPKSEYIEIVRNNLKQLSQLGLNARLVGYYNINDDTKNTEESLLKIVRAVNIDTHFPYIRSRTALATGYGRNIYPQLPLFNCGIPKGYMVTVDGQLWYKKDYLTEREKLGSIFEAGIPDRPYAIPFIF